ncbi:preprotein translocase subunit SecG [Clostridium thailandense]|uniref:Protein-export membrane protein SecG n=1 Tax=Clostridium thailandense TaxID=2794346 RepID=A0A949TX64_9CLOT|nr:preprotein translocase subunit SecG [Clostridium thailandense]MBV7273175.1 preprotein translocase subunit SecG [Clostridium thailandense]MCH5136032.1 preprotein translocase subunit SecG [Clostridiaceae bacterium UIB06]
MRVALTIAQSVIAIILIVVVLLQPSKTNGLSGLVSGGTTESFYSKNKSRTSEAMLSKITIVCAVIFAVLCILQNIVK